MHIICAYSEWSNEIDHISSRVMKRKWEESVQKDFTTSPVDTITETQDSVLFRTSYTVLKTASAPR
jgi:nitroimidazol reductase NimA-like FMN-containing flavoprotein (pyridoxamine 5'-phosphate oxidase superfamily)